MKYTRVSFIISYLCFTDCVSPHLSYLFNVTNVHLQLKISVDKNFNQFIQITQLVSLENQLSILCVPYYVSCLIFTCETLKIIYIAIILDFFF